MIDRAAIGYLPRIEVVSKTLVIEVCALVRNQVGLFTLPWPTHFTSILHVGYSAIALLRHDGKRIRIYTRSRFGKVGGAAHFNNNLP